MVPKKQDEQKKKVNYLQFGFCECPRVPIPPLPHPLPPIPRPALPREFYILTKSVKQSTRKSYQPPSSYQLSPVMRVTDRQTDRQLWPTRSHRATSFLMNHRYDILSRIYMVPGMISWSVSRGGVPLAPPVPVSGNVAEPRIRYACLGLHTREHCGENPLVPAAENGDKRLMNLGCDVIR